MSDAGDHEGWVARLLEDGREEHGSTGRRRDDGSVEFVELVGVAGDPDGEEQVSSDRVVSWVPRCTCGWRGSLWQRVTELHLADDAARRGWRPLGEVGDEPQHVEEFAHAEWRQHLQPHAAAAAVHRAAAAVAEHQQHLEQAVIEARQLGLSWEKIGAAAGISRQAAHERWGSDTTRRSAEARSPWFGSLLRWHRTPRGWAADYAGRTYEIVKVDRETADEQGGGMRPGWHFATHPDAVDDPDDRQAFGPGLGRTLPSAKYLAEAWLTTPRSDRQAHDDAPNLLLALGGAGAVFRSGTARLCAWVDTNDQRRINIAPTDGGATLATITPHFATGEGGRVAITWAAALIDGTAVASTPTWREAAAAVGDAVATDTSEDR